MLKNNFEGVEGLSSQYRYYYQGEKCTRQTRLYEYHEATKEEHKQIAECIGRVSKDDEWLKVYLVRYYQVPKQDGQTEADYLAKRCAGLLSKEEMQRSWSKKGV